MEITDKQVKKLVKKTTRVPKITEEEKDAMGIMKDYIDMIKFEE